MKAFPTLLTAMLVVITLNACVSLSIGETYGIVAQVNGKPITSMEVRDAVEAQEQMIHMTIRDPDEAHRRLADLHERALDALIVRQLVLSEFDKLGGSLKPEYIDDEIKRIILETFGGDRDKFIVELTKTGMTLKKFRDLQEKQIVVQALKQQHTRGIAPATPAEVSSYYNKHIEQFRDKDFVKISTITIPKYPVGGDAGVTVESQRKLAEEVRTKITGGGDFTQLAKTYSQDSHADQGGEWDWIERSQMDKKVAETAFSLKSGAVSKVVDVGTSYMIILCVAKRPGPEVPLEKVRPDIEKIIKTEKSRDAINGWLISLARKATILPVKVRDGFMSRLGKELE
ncbi:MAG TPA: peptidylprolyl isomerase [Verrucomicrobiaceae bacterium]|jgi:parvulin-like peptidyl-prolyl isomerase